MYAEEMVLRKDRALGQQAVTQIQQPGALSSLFLGDNLLHFDFLSAFMLLTYKSMI